MIKRLIFKLNNLTVSNKVKLLLLLFFRGLVASRLKSLVELNEVLNFVFDYKGKFSTEGKYVVVEVTVNNSNLRFKLRENSSDIAVFAQIIAREEFKFILDHFDNLNFQHKPFKLIDAGANIGLVSMYFCSIFSSIDIIAVEPSDKNLEVLESNLRFINNKNLSIVKKALWSESTTLIPSSFGDNRDWAFSLAEAETSTLTNKSEAIPSISMLQLLDEFKWDEVDFLKIDIEGAERELFNDPYFDLWIGKVKAISVEVHEKFVSQATIVEKLEKTGFRVFQTGELVVGFNN